jgi:hypothetical protein
MLEPRTRGVLAAVLAAVLCSSACAGASQAHHADSLRTYLQTIHPIEHRLRVEVAVLNEVGRALEATHGPMPAEAETAHALAERLQLDALRTRDVRSTNRIDAVNVHLAATFDGFAAYAGAASRALASGDSDLAHRLLTAPPPAIAQVPTEIAAWRDGVEALAREHHLAAPTWITRITVGEASSAAT